MSQTLRQLREAHGFTQEQAARLAGLEQTHISQLERGTIPNPGVATLRGLSRAYDRSMDDILAALRASLLVA